MHACRPDGALLWGKSFLQLSFFLLYRKIKEKNFALLLAVIHLKNYFSLG